MFNYTRGIAVNTKKILLSELMMYIVAIAVTVVYTMFRNDIQRFLVKFLMEKFGCDPMSASLYVYGITITGIMSIYVYVNLYYKIRLDKKFNEGCKKYLEDIRVSNERMKDNLTNVSKRMDDHFDEIINIIKGH